jgi:hypothetical protein
MKIEEVMAQPDPEEMKPAKKGKNEMSVEEVVAMPDPEESKGRHWEHR